MTSTVYVFSPYKIISSYDPATKTIHINAQVIQNNVPYPLGWNSQKLYIICSVKANSKELIFFYQNSKELNFNKPK